MSRHHRHINIDPVSQQVAVIKTVAKGLNKADTDQGKVMDHRVQRTGEAIFILSGYIAYRIDLMMDVLKGETPSAFVNKLRNRSAGIVRACDEFHKTIEPYIEGDEKHKAYLWFSDIITNALDSLFEDMHQDEPEASAQIRRRAKLRYHDPYPTDVKERTEAFEDGYTKGYGDAMCDFVKEVAKLSDGPNSNLSVGIVDGKITIKPIGQ